MSKPTRPGMERLNVKRYKSGVTVTTSTKKAPPVIPRKQSLRLKDNPVSKESFPKETPNDDVESGLVITVSPKVKDFPKDERLCIRDRWSKDSSKDESLGSKDSLNRSSLSSVDSLEDQGVIGRSSSASSDSLSVTSKESPKEPASTTRSIKFTASPPPIPNGHSAGRSSSASSDSLSVTSKESPKEPASTTRSIKFTASPPPIPNGHSAEKETKEPKGKESGLYVGFANLPNQVHRKSVKKGFEFTLMVVGESGLGKSTLVNSLFLTNLYDTREIPSATNKIKKTVEIKTSTVEIEEKGVRLKLTVVDTPGFGDAVDSSRSWEPIVNYINNQYNTYLKDESGLNRRNIADNRVHCCLYFVNPIGHGLKPIDINVMKALHNKVNIVPVIAKADTLTKREVKELKSRILREVAENHIQIYQFPEADEDEEDAEFIQINKELKESIPFAVVGSNLVYEINGRKVRGRTYPWGIVDIENPQHCDFTMLRNMLIRTHMQDLKDVTQEIHYENFRAQQLAGGEMNPVKLLTNEDRKKRQSGIQDERDQLLLQKELELKKMQEMLTRMQAEMAAAKQ